MSARRKVLPSCVGCGKAVHDHESALISALSDEQWHPHCYLTHAQASAGQAVDNQPSEQLPPVTGVSDAN